MSDALNATPPCGNCGGTLVEHYGPTEEGCWWYHCRSCAWEYGNNAELLSPLTTRTAPWTAPVVAAVLAMLDERIAALNLEIDAHRSAHARGESLRSQDRRTARRDALKVFRREVSGGSSVGAKLTPMVGTVVANSVVVVEGSIGTFDMGDSHE